MNTTLRQKLIDEGVLVERGFRLPEVRHSKRVLRLDSLGRDAAAAHIRDRRFQSSVPSVHDILSRPPRYGRRPG